MACVSGARPIITSSIRPRGAANSLLDVTVIAPRAIRPDPLSTAIFVSGEAHAPRLLAAYPARGPCSWGISQQSLAADGVDAPAAATVRRPLPATTLLAVFGIFDQTT